MESVHGVPTRLLPHPPHQMSKPNILRSLGDDRLRLFVATAVGLFASVVIGLCAVGFAGNPVKNLMLLFGGAMLILASLKPHFGLYLLILSTACLDFVKRFLVLFGVGSMGDVMGILAVAPMILAGIALGVFVLHPIFTKRMLIVTERRLFFLSIFLISIPLASGIRSGGLDAFTLGNAVNKSAYSLLVPIVYVLYRQRGVEEIKRLLHFSVIVFALVALYGIQQWMFGFNQFETDYMRSGLTITGDLLYERHPRPFSTLNSPHAFSVVMAMFSVLSVVLCLKPLKSAKGFFSSAGRFLLPVLFFTACFLSFVRSSWLVALIGIACIFIFRTKTRTVAFYAIFSVSFSLLVWQADNIYAGLDRLQGMLPQGSDIKEQAFRVGTYSERLFGFQNVFRNRSMWTWFGNPDLAYRVGQHEVRDEVVHDALGQTLVTYGFVGLFAMLCIGSFSLLYLHRRVLAAPPGPTDVLGRGLLSISIAIIVSGMIAGAHLSVFPINTLFWLSVGALVVTTQKQSASQRRAREEPIEPAPPAGRKRAGTPLRPVAHPRG